MSLTFASEASDSIAVRAAVFSSAPRVSSYSVCQLPFAILLGKVTTAAFEHGYDVSGLLAAVSHPVVVKATVKSAQIVGPEGAADRKMLLPHSNFLPVRKGAAAVFRLQQQINTQEGSNREPTSLPLFESDVIAFNAAQRG